MLKKVSLKGSMKMVEDGSRAAIEIRAITGDKWIDLGYWLEGVSFMANQAMQSQNMSKSEMIDYIAKYLQESVGEPE